MKSPINVPSEHIKRISINGMNGRMVHIPNNKSKKAIIYIHGLHTSAERHYSLCQFLSDFGSVYAPDMPGFGGMDSFYKVGLNPDYDNYANYVYTLIKSLGLPKDTTIYFIGLSFGSQVMTRLLQKHPDLVQKGNQAIAFAGMGAPSDLNSLFMFKMVMYPIMYFGSKKYLSNIMRVVALNPISLRLFLGISLLTNSKLRNDTNHRSQIVAMEYNLWRNEDFRTHAATAWMMFRESLLSYQEPKISLKLHNISIGGDQYINSDRAAITFKQLYKEYEVAELDMDAHAPSLVADKETVVELFPEATRKLLAS